MKIKKVIAVIAGIAVTLSAAVGGVYGYKSYQDKKLIAEVQPVSNLNWGYWGRHGDKLRHRHERFLTGDLSG